MSTPKQAYIIKTGKGAFLKEAVWHRDNIISVTYTKEEAEAQKLTRRENAERHVRKLHELYHHGAGRPMFTAQEVK